MPHFVPRCMHLLSCHFIGGKRIPGLCRIIVRHAREAESGGLREVGLAVQKSIFGATLRGMPHACGANRRPCCGPRLKPQLEAKTAAISIQRQ